jgi:hypothetical protein
MLLCQTGQTRKDVKLAGDWLCALKVGDKYSFEIQERVIKVAELAGLIQIASDMLNKMIIEKKECPSSICYIAVLNGLRKVKRLDIMRETMANLSNVCRAKNRSLQTIALNSYFNGMCDVMRKGSLSNSEDLFEEALDLLRPNAACERFNVKEGPDTISFNILLNTARLPKFRDTKRFNEILQLMRASNVDEDVYTYNLRLKSCIDYEGKMEIIDEMLSRSMISPDKYTVEQALLPLAKEGRLGELLELLRDYNENSESSKSKSNAYSTFLLSLVKV